MPITRDPRINTGDEFYLSLDPRRAACRHFLPFVRDRARGKRLLDFGCGIGAYAYELGQQGFQVSAVEPNERYVRIARENGVDAIVGDGDPLPFPDGHFDTVYALEVLEHIPDEKLTVVLPELRRVTRGNLLVTVPDSTQYDEFVRTEFLPGHFRAVDHVQFFTNESLRAFLSPSFARVTISRGDPLFPHHMLPPIVRKPISALYRLGLLKPNLMSRLFAEASVHA
jgi:SAM-dependent methyltransferase